MFGFNLHWIYAHLIGDYLLSNDYISKKKKISHLWCLIHVIFYMIPFLFTTLNLLQLFLIAIQHYVQDKWNFINWFCKKTGKFQSNSVKAWGHILIDNIIHILWILFVYNIF